MTKDKSAGADLREMAKELTAFCWGIKVCYDCPLHVKKHCYTHATRDEIEENYRLIKEARYDV